VTRADVAKLAGVSPAVVSYVLNPGSRPVSASARARIEAAIAELGYRPNAIAQALRRSSTMSMGLMVPNLGHVVVADTASALEDIAYELGYVLFVGSVGDDRERAERYLRTYVDRQVDAIIVIGSLAPELMAQIADEPLPVIVLDEIGAGSGISSIHTESRESSREVVTHLIEQHGHERIGCVTSSGSRSRTTGARVAGWRDALDAHGLPSGDDWVFTSAECTRTSGALGADTLLDSVAPTAFFTTSDMQAVGLIGAIRHRGLMVPRDIAVVSYENSDLAVRAFPGLTSVDCRTDEVARLAMERLVARLRDGALPETHDVVPTEIVYRASCGCDVPLANPAAST
jgi:LacI family transcriptional regulator